MTEAWETDAQEFGRWVSGWRARLLVARNVEKGEGQTKGLRHVVANETTTGKISARAFAERAGTSKDTVLRALKRWDEAYGQGAPIPYSSDLVPSQEIDLSLVEAWEEAYEEEDEEKPEGQPFTVASDIIAAAGKKVLAVRDVEGLDEQDRHDLERPLSDLEACIADVRDFLEGTTT